MQEKTITVQEALNDLKVLDSRISRKTHDKIVVGMEVRSALSSPSNSKKTVEDFRKDSTSHIQSTLDLINYRKALKSAVIKSNGTTEIEVAGRKITVAEAIEYKQSISLEYELLSSINKQISQAEVNVSRLNSKIEDEILQKEKLVLGPDSDKQSSEAVLEVIRKDAEKNLGKIIMPEIEGKSADEWVNEKNDELEQFLANVDFALTASNVTTKITVVW